MLEPLLRAVCALLICATVRMKPGWPVRSRTVLLGDGIDHFQRPLSSDAEPERPAMRRIGWSPLALVVAVALVASVAQAAVVQPNADAARAISVQWPGYGYG